MNICQPAKPIVPVGVAPTSNIVQVTPTSRMNNGVIDGNERRVLYLDKALNIAAAIQGINLRTTIVALDRAETGTFSSDHTVLGTTWRTQGIAAKPLIETLRAADIVYVHQCMTKVGLFAAAHAKLLGKRVFGSDAGTGEDSILHWAPDILRMYSGLHSFSEFAALAFDGYNVPVHVIPEPINCEFYAPKPKKRDARLVVCIGRILPHRGFERVIRALPASLCLTIVGQHEDATYLAFLRDCARGRNVQFLHGLDDEAVRHWLLRAGLFIDPSTHTDYQGRFYHKPELSGLAPLEAIATGLTTLVSNAGALSELGKLPGCYVFNDDKTLTSLLHDATSRRLQSMDPAEMHRAVTDNYGLAAVGMALLDMMSGSASCAS